MSVSRLDGISRPQVRPRPQVAERSRIKLAVLAWWQGAQLDRELAAGASPSASAILEIRARRITRQRSRRRIAGGLIGALRRAKSGTPQISTAIPPQTREVLAARAVLTALDQRLRTAEPVSARGVALLLTLLTDGNSPLYQPDGPGTLGSRLRAAAAALEPDRRG